MQPRQPNNQDDGNQQHGQEDNDLGEAHNLLLDKRRLGLAIGGELVDATHQGLITLQDHDTDTRPLDHMSAHERNVLGLEKVLVRHSRARFNGFRLACEDRAIESSVGCGLKDAKIRGDLVSEQEGDAIANDKVRGHDVHKDAITDNITH